MPASEPREEARNGAAPLALPEPEVEVVLVGPRIATEPSVTIDAKDRAEHPGLGSDVRRELGQDLTCRDHERLGWREPEPLVVGSVGLKPVLAVVDLQLLEESEGLGREAVERGHAGLAR
jgi:hypothetical protein